MRYLVVSDIHSNWEALQAVLRAAQGQYELIVSCGDLVGYGPDPNRVVDWARESLHATIRGNHDRACCGMDDLEWFNPVAQAATRWTIGKLTPENALYLRNLPRGPALEGPAILVHGSPLDEDEYVSSIADASNIFPYLESGLTFFGHTHLQGGFAWLRGTQGFVDRPTERVARLQLFLDPAGCWLVNPGSVGQPRDGDPRAAYALFDSGTNQLVLGRAAYDTEAVCAKIVQAGLPPALGSRLALGR